VWMDIANTDGQHYKRKVSLKCSSVSSQSAVGRCIAMPI